MPSEPSEEGKEFACQFCRRRFRRVEHKKRHERLHTNEQPYPCLRCERRFTRKDLLNRHMTTKHSHDALETVPQNFQFAPTQANEQQADEQQGHDTFINPLWDLSLSQLQFNDFVSPPDCLNTDLATSAQDQSLWSNVLDFAPVDDDRSDISMPSVPVQQMGQWLGMDNNSSNPKILPDYSSDLMTDSLHTANAVQNSMTAINAAQNHQVCDRSDSLNVLNTQHAVTQTSDVTGPDPNLHYESFLLRTTPHLWNLEVDDIQKLNSQRMQFSSVIPPAFTMPSKATLSRYIYLFEKRYQAQFPMLHTATFKADQASLDLILSIAATGSTFCHDEENAIKMFVVAREVTLERVRRKRKSSDGAMDRQLDRETDTAFENGLEARKDTLQILQALVMQTNLAYLLDLHSGLTQVNELKTYLTNCLRDYRLPLSAGVHGSSWEEWALWEGIKRAVYVSFSVLTQAAVLTSHPPVFMNYEIDIELPCTEDEWQCATQEEWRAVQASSKSPQLFQTALRQLLDNVGDVDSHHYSAFSNHVLLLALLQHFQLLRQLDVRSSNDVDLYYDVSSHYSTLSKWRRMWESCTESSLDPLSSYGSLAFTSAILYHTAFVRNALDLGRINVLDDVSHIITATKLLESRPVYRSPRVSQLVTHAVCALEISLQFGFIHVASDKSPILTMEFAVCALQCCVLLTKWLSAVTAACVSPELSQDEQKLLEIVSDLLEGVAPCHLGNRSDNAYANERNKLSARVAETWEKLFSGVTLRLFVRLRTVIDCYGDLLATV